MKKEKLEQQAQEQAQVLVETWLSEGEALSFKENLIQNRFSTLFWNFRDSEDDFIYGNFFGITVLEKSEKIMLSKEIQRELLERAASAESEKEIYIIFDWLLQTEKGDNKLKQKWFKTSKNDTFKKVWKDYKEDLFFPEPWKEKLRKKLEL